MVSCKDSARCMCTWLGSWAKSRAVRFVFGVGRQTSPLHCAIVIWLWLSNTPVMTTPSHASDSRGDVNNAQERAVVKTSHP
jgi:hypothetical protein